MSIDEHGEVVDAERTKYGIRVLESRRGDILGCCIKHASMGASGADAAVDKEWSAKSEVWAFKVMVAYRRVVRRTLGLPTESKAPKLD